MLEDYLNSVEGLRERVARLTRSIAEMVETWALGPTVKALQALRGVNLLNAVVLVAEVGDFQRFATAPQFMGYLGLVPSEHSSGETRHQGRITRAATATHVGRWSRRPGRIAFGRVRARTSELEARESLPTCSASLGGRKNASAPGTGS